MPGFIEMPHTNVVFGVATELVILGVAAWLKGLDKVRNISDEVSTIDRVKIGGVKYDAIVALGRADHAIKNIEDSTATSDGVTKYVKDYIKGNANLSFDSILGDLLNANAAFALYHYTNTRKEFRDIASAIDKAIDAVRVEYRKERILKLINVA
ncbi:hypothetical protein [Candidatus Regiella insecticola]|uniref:Uncharacterized protein n=1 Tax=Candidatus Regiella insecticola TaxID=138073 RepID=A0A6L2ZRY1_9ENTR|nr:hypothetical protein [Candidatus Regiella insecticola]GFN46948.1 hypothetical protein RINTU1_27740 [Candidatus Regiella insecticola]